MTTPTAPRVRLPDARDDSSPYTIACICLGNICRSPTAEVVLTTYVADAGLDRLVQVDSAGTGDWHIGEKMDARAASTLTARGFDPSAHRAACLDASRLHQYDLVLVMDHHNLRDVRAMVLDETDHERIMMFRVFDPEAGESLDVPDPWSGEQAGFDEVLAIVERTSRALTAALGKQLSTPSDTQPRTQVTGPGSEPGSGTFGR